MPIVSLTAWNQFLQSQPDAHLLQTSEWGELKSAFGWEAVRMVGGETGVQILFRTLPLGLTIGYIPKPVLSKSLLEISNSFWQEIDAICRRQRAIFLKIEPDLWEGDHPDSLFTNLPIPNYQFTNSQFTASQFQISPYNIQPPRTIIVDLKTGEEEILARMKQKTRYNIRLAEKKGVTVRAWDDLEAFHKMMLVTGGRDGFGVHSLDYYQRAYELLHRKQMAELLVAEYEKKPLAAVFVARHGNRAYYLYGASTDEERNRMPAYLLQWEAMKWAKGLGCEEYDLWGVPDEKEAILEANFEKRSDGLWGVYRFKRGFGGKLKRVAQAFDRVYYPFLYRAYLKFMRNRE